MRRTCLDMVHKLAKKENRGKLLVKVVLTLLLREVNCPHKLLT